MLFAIDIGNTHTVLGIFRGRKLLGTWRISTSPSRTKDELWVMCRPCFEERGIRPRDITGVVIASVVPNLTASFEETVRERLKEEPLVISSELDFGMPILYDDPRSVGADRLCNAVAAFAKYGGPCIVVDFGTATTYDVISKDGEYLGGVIAPGLETSGAELHRRAALLPKIDLHFPEKIIGTNTVASMQAGILYGAVDAMEGMLRRIKKAVGRHAVVIATGGFSKAIAQQSQAIDYVEPNLVLEGAVRIFQRVRGKKK